MVGKGDGIMEVKTVMVGFELGWCACMETVLGYLDRMFKNGGELNEKNWGVELPDGCENEKEEMIRKLYFIKDRNEKGI